MWWGSPWGVPFLLLPQWLCGKSCTWAYGVHHVPKCMRCHKAIVVMIRRARCFHDGIYIAPILFLWDLSSNYADDTIPYIWDSQMEKVIEKLGKNAEKLFQWFYNNFLKTNHEKCHFLKRNSEKTAINIRLEKISSSSSQKLLGI